MKPLHLAIRTPQGLVVDRPVRGIQAEDRSGWFGIRPGRLDLVAALPPGLLVFTDAEGEGFVALSGGLLELRGPDCRVVCTEAVWSRELDTIAATLEAQHRRRAQGAALHRGTVADLAKEAMRRLVRQGVQP